MDELKAALASGVNVAGLEAAAAARDAGETRELKSESQREDRAMFRDAYILPKLLGRGAGSLRARRSCRGSVRIVETRLDHFPLLVLVRAWRSAPRRSHQPSSSAPC